MKLNVVIPERATEIRITEITFNLDALEVSVHMIIDGRLSVQALPFSELNKGISKRDLTVIGNYLNLPIEKILKTQIDDKKIFDQPELPPQFGGEAEGFR